MFIERKYIFVLYSFLVIEHFTLVWPPTDGAIIFILNSLIIT